MINKTQEVLKLLISEKVALVITRYSGATYIVLVKNNRILYKQFNSIPTAELTTIYEGSVEGMKSIMLHDIEYSLSQQPDIEHFKLLWKREEDQLQYNVNLLSRLCKQYNVNAILLKYKRSFLIYWENNGERFINSRHFRVNTSLWRDILDYPAYNLLSNLAVLEALDNTNIPMKLYIKNMEDKDLDVLKFLCNVIDQGINGVGRKLRANERRQLGNKIQQIFNIPKPIIDNIRKK